MLRVGLVGAGKVGQRRAAVAAAHPRTELALVCDLDPKAAAATAASCGARVAASWQELVEARELDIVVVSTVHQSLAQISAAALEAGKHVLCEKPGGRNPGEVRAAVEAAEKAGRCLKAGYNHRYHPAIARLRQWCEQGGLGQIDFIRGRYGHGGRPGYEREWRADPAKAGGGELLDQGAHLVDLCLWFLGDFAAVSGFVATRFWDIAPLEDNAFGLFQTAAGQVASLHVSWTQWKNVFSFEVFGHDGYGLAQGLGGSYGTESVVLGVRPQHGGVPDEERVEFARQDLSWALEWEDFVSAVENHGIPHSSGREALRTMEWIYRLYRAAEQRRVVAQWEDVT